MVRNISLIRYFISDTFTLSAGFTVCEYSYFIRKHCFKPLKKTDVLVDELHMIQTIFYIFYMLVSLTSNETRSMRPFYKLVI